MPIASETPIPVVRGRSCDGARPASRCRDLRHRLRASALLKPLLGPPGRLRSHTILEKTMNKSGLPTSLKNALGTLLDDHRKVDKLFKDFEKAKTSAEKEQIARTVCNELTVHAALEEELFYPAVRQLDPEKFGDLLDEANVEHASVKNLITQIEAMGAEDALFDAKVTVLGEYVKHHVQEEEGELFPKLVAEKPDLREIAEKMEARRPALSKAA
jgi:hemerythrin superfamily protein